MLRPRLQKRINHFYRNCGRENNNHRERIYHGLVVEHRYTLCAFIFILFSKSPSPQKINENALQTLFIDLIQLTSFDQTNNNDFDPWFQNYDTLSKGKKSWSVRLGLSRQSQATDDPQGKGWGTISGGSGISRQMIYGDPWLYGTVRSSRPGHEPRGFMTPPPPPPPGAPVLVVCSCPEFLAGTTRKLGNCRKCGGHRLAGVPLGGTCRLPPISSRSRPSLAGKFFSPPIQSKETRGRSFNIFSLPSFSRHRRRKCVSKRKTHPPPIGTVRIV